MFDRKHGCYQTRKVEMEVSTLKLRRRINLDLPVYHISRLDSRLLWKSLTLFPIPSLPQAVLSSKVFFKSETKLTRGFLFPVFKLDGNDHCTALNQAHKLQASRSYNALLCHQLFVSTSRSPVNTLYCLLEITYT